ncbi:protein wntless-like isoform X1 [Penaeus chinensis]|uniref:protein wntless-like isoform X1 n=1 Tax=Penaeus chinensis TaxID=139456 RepID=UPI001FB5F24F|nr:protein wntless-like isoform X1 [Penaeus chinensis]
MAGAIIENLSGRKLGILIGFLMICQIACFLVGGLIAPSPSSVMSMLGTKCIDKNYKNTQWYWSRGKQPCKSIGDFDSHIVQEQMISANDIVFSFQIPIPKDGYPLDYSRWQQNLIAMLHLDILYDDEDEVAPDAVMTLDARLGYSNRGDPEGKWTEYASSVEQRHLDCSIEQKKTGYMYNCSHVPLFELGSLHHDYYLLNVRLPVNMVDSSEETGMNTKLGHIHDMWVAFIHQNGGFTKVWVSLKTIFFPIIVAIMVWFWRRISQLSRPPALLEYMLMVLGAALTLLNCPLEYLTLAFDCPWMTVVSDIRQGLFYASLLSFWLIFAGEHLMIADDIERNRIRVYWRHLSAVLGGCLCLFIFDMCERGVQLRNPFYSIWATEIGTNLALAFIILAGVCAGLYFCFLSYMIWKVFMNISSKRQSLPAMSSARRLHYEGIIYRFKVLMLATLLCAAMTVIGFILGQVSEGQWTLDDNIKLEYTSGFFTGVYGMWNIYTFALICLYAPSHKRWPKDQNWPISDSCDTQSSTGEEIEFSRLATEPSEMSSLTAFTKKSATD